MRGRRVLYATLVVCTIIAGLASRRYAESLPHVIATYAGDVLWASMVYWLLVTFGPRASVRRLAATALGIAVLVEFSQLLHTPWLDAFRAHRFGALVLGQGFLWSDVVCYSIGVVLAATSDRSVRLHLTAPTDAIRS